jgi:hypothetical protein
LGLPERFPETMINIISVTNMGDGTYNVLFDAPVTVAEGDGDPGILLWEQDNIQWVQVFAGHQVDANTVNFLDSNGGGDSDCTYFMITPTQSILTAAQPLPICAPAFAIS